MVEREWILLNPGPANTSPAVRGALLMPQVLHAMQAALVELEKRASPLASAGTPRTPAWCGRE